MTLARILSIALFVSPCAALCGQLPTQKSGGPGKPLSPQEAVKLFQLPKGLRIELVACEPQIESPVAMAFAPDGKLWVVEMRDYPNGPAKGEKPAGRIRVLEDKDGDGFYETSRVWADELLFANGLIHWDDGLIVTAAPHILFLRDTDGDGKADERKILYEGFAAENPQLRLSHPILGLDGWIYCANGLRGGKVIKHGDKNAKPIDLSGMDFRFHPGTGQAEAISGLGQYGNTFDDWGNRFVCDNRHHLRHIVIENRYLKRNPNLAAPGVVEDISILDDGPLSSGGKIYPISKNWTTSSLHEGRFTAACGVFIYRGQLLGKPYSGAAFTCDPTGNLVHGETMEQKGATFQSWPFEKGKEFLASPDDWFRPVFLTHGPDDALYIVDMYRAVIEHPEFMPPELQKRPDLTLGKDKGRIWRVVPEKHKTTAIRPRLHVADPVELSSVLESSSPWRRITAQMLIATAVNKATEDMLRTERQEDRVKAHKQWLAVVEPLKQLSEKTKNPLARLHLHLGPSHEDRVRSFRDAHPRVREGAVSRAVLHINAGAEFTAKFSGVDLIKQKLLNQSRELKELLLAMGDDPDPRVRFQLALTLGEIKNDRTLPALVKIALAGAEDKWTRLAVESSLAGKAEPFLGELFKEQRLATIGSVELVREVAALAAAEGKTVAVLGHAARWQGPNDWPMAAAVGLAEGLTRKGKTISTEIGTKASPELTAIRRWFFEELLPLARRQALDAKLPVGERLASLKLINQDQWGQSKKPLLALLQDDPAMEIRLAAVRSISSFPGDEASKVLMENWRSYGPAVRREVTEAMFRDAKRLGLFLDEIDAKRIRPGELDALRTRQLVTHGNADIRARAQKLLKDNLPADRAKVLAEYQPALTMKGDAKRGLEIFKKNCATCHRVAGVGIDVAPDIADTRTKTLAALLTDIISPNAAIDNNYVNYIVFTKSGKTITGLLTAETASSITLKRAEGQSDVVLRADIDEIQSTGVSLMPEGLEKTVTVAEMADLLSFLKNWRYLDGSVPTGN